MIVCAMGYVFNAQSATATIIEFNRGNVSGSTPALWNRVKANKCSGPQASCPHCSQRQHEAEGGEAGDKKQSEKFKDAVLQEIENQSISVDFTYTKEA